MFKGALKSQSAKWLLVLILLGLISQIKLASVCRIFIIVWLNAASYTGPQGIIASDMIGYNDLLAFL